MRAQWTSNPMTGAGTPGHPALPASACTTADQHATAALSALIFSREPRTG